MKSDEPGRKASLIAPELDRESLLIDARRELKMPSRRLFGKQLISLGGLAMLTGCSLSDNKSVETFLARLKP